MRKIQDHSLVQTWPLMGAMFLAAPHVAWSQPSPQGQAAILAERLVDSLGGAQAWTAAETLCLVEETAQAGGAGTARLHYYRDLKRPRIRVDSADGHMILSSNGAWRTAGATTEVFTPERVKRFVEGWPSNIYVLYRRLAAADPRLTLQSNGSSTLDIYEDGRRISSITLGADGGPARWVRYGSMGTATEEWNYGPLRSFGALRFPSWGVRADRSESFSYADVRLSGNRFADEQFPDSPLPHGSLASPRC